VFKPGIKVEAAGNYKVEITDEKGVVSSQSTGC
jgi:hypothetical protein